MIGCVALATSIVTVAAISAPFKADAANFAFNNIFKADGTTDNNNGDSINNQFSFSVVDGTGVNAGKTVWTFGNAVGGAASFINEIYFDWTTPLTILQNTGAVANTNGQIVSQIGSTIGTGNNNVEFKFGATPQELPQAPTKLPSGNNFEANLGIEPTSEGGQKSGIDVGQQLVLLFGNSNVTDIESQLISGDLKVGIHVKGIGAQDNSDSYINRRPTKPVPVPGFVLGVMAAGALGGTRLLKNKKQAV